MSRRSIWPRSSLAGQLDVPMSALLRGWILAGLNARKDESVQTAIEGRSADAPGVVLAFVLLCVPLLSFVGQCSRVGAPARGRRLAVVRMAGASPRDVVRVVCVESGLAAALGSGVGLAAYLVGRVALDHPVRGSYAAVRRVVGPGGVVQVGATETGASQTGFVRRLPTDVRPCCSCWGAGGSRPSACSSAPSGSTGDG